MNHLVNWHLEHHPLMEPQDIVKLIFQAKLGCGHLLADEATVTSRIKMEEASLQPVLDEPLTEPLGPDYVRVNLRRAMADHIRPEWLARLMLQSTPHTHPSRTDVVKEISTLNNPAVNDIASRLLSEPDWIPSHTQSYHTAYAPAYRVISTRCAAALPVLQALTGQWHKDRLLLCIDGPCGSGKTTLANILRQVLDAPVISMDDFFLPHPQKTPQRLAQPGGNADWERLVQEFLLPWQAHGQASYRRYDCHTDAMGDLMSIPPSKVTIIEGSYSLMPEIRKHADLCIFLDIQPHEQQKRILQRNGERMLQMFIDRWIPLETAYFSAFGLPDENCIVVSQQSV